MQLSLDSSRSLLLERGPSEVVENTEAVHSGPGCPPEKTSRAVVAALWSVSIAVSAVAAWWAYHRAASHTGVRDLRIYVQAAREVAAGRSPYLVTSPSLGYVYTPLVAIILAPFCHMPFSRIVEGWRAATLAGLGVSAFVVAKMSCRGGVSYLPPVVFCMSVVTATFAWPMSAVLQLGQVDGILVGAFSLSLFLSHRGMKRSGAGVAAGAAMVKLWPLLALTAFRGAIRGSRARAMCMWLGAFLIAVAMCLVFGGWRVLSVADGHLASRRGLNIISYTVWGIPRILYSKNAGAMPVVDSALLRIGATVLLAFFVLATLVFATRLALKGSNLGFWEALGCISFLLPMSHSFYALYLLPLVWVWVARALRKEHRTTMAIAVAAAMLLWWLVMVHAWPSDLNADPWSASLPISVPFFASLLACGISVLGDWRLFGRDVRPVVGILDVQTHGRVQGSGQMCKD